MVSRTERSDRVGVLRQVFHPPLHEWRFWAIQFSVILIAGLHIFADLNLSNVNGAFPAGIPVAVLIVPIGYAAFRYGLAGSAATSLWATILWLPDLLLPNDRGHVGADIINLILVDLVAFAFGERIKAERQARTREEQATAMQRSAEAGYRQLFDSNRAPIFLLDSEQRIVEANSAARALFDGVITRSMLHELMEIDDHTAELNGQTHRMRDGRDYRIGLVDLPAHDLDASTQLIFEDVTNELGEGRRATQYARLVVKVEEEQRRGLARELHDEPLQLFLHLARRLEALGSVDGVPSAVSSGLEEAREQALDAATRLRMLARDLRPPSLDQLGLVAALSSLLSDVEEETDLETKIAISGVPRRLSADIELGAFRIVQESVRNALRHAHAQRLSLTVEFSDDGLSLRVRDDGRGFVLRESEDISSSRLGILGMRERSNLLGGRLEIRSIPGSETTVELLIPLSVSKDLLDQGGKR